MCPVVNLRALAQGGNITLYSLRQAEKLQRLVDQVWANIKPQATTRYVLLAPADANLRAEAVDMRLEMLNLADQPCLMACLMPR